MTDDYSDYQAPLEDNILSEITNAALRQKTLEAELAKLDENLSIKKAELKNMAEIVIPDLMDKAGMTSFQLKDGSKIEVAETVRASIPAEFKSRAFKWLADHNHDALIKEQFTFDFDRDQTELSEEFGEFIKNKYPALRSKHKKSVHPSTLSSFVKGQLVEGVDIPLTYFGVYRQRVAKIKG